MPPRILPLPKIAPIILVERPLPFDDPDWLFEPKFDGFRGLLYIDRNEATFHSKRGLVFKRFSRLAADVRDHPMPMIFISGFGQTGISLPGSIFLKPFSTQELLTEVRRLLGGDTVQH